MAKCKICGAPVNLAPDGDPRYDPPRKKIMAATNDLWRRVEDELPEENDLCESKRVMTYSMCGGMDYTYTQHGKWQTHHLPVSHWMPIEPPKDL